MGIGPRVHNIGLDEPCGLHGCPSCALILATARRPGEPRTTYIARLRARYRPSMLAAALAASVSAEVCPDCGRVRQRDLPCATCADPLSTPTVTGVA